MLMTEATSYDNISQILVLRVCGFRPNRILLKILIFFFLKLGRLDEQVIDAGREFQIF